MDWGWLKKLEPATLAVMFTSGVLGLVVGIANGVVQKRHGGWPSFWTAFVMGIVVAILVGLGISEWVKSEALRLCIVGACAVVADDIWAGLKTLGQGMRTDPLGVIARLIDAFRGKGATAVPTPVPDKD